MVHIDSEAAYQAVKKVFEETSSKAVSAEESADILMAVEIGIKILDALLPMITAAIISEVDKARGLAQDK